MDSKTEIAPASRLRWLMISLVFAATVVLYIDRQALAVVAPVLGRQFHMSNVAYSRVVFAFMLAYTISNGCSGAFLDRVGTKIGYAVCMGWWAVAALLHALAPGPLSLGVCRFLLGIGAVAGPPLAVWVVVRFGWHAAFLGVGALAILWLAAWLLIYRSPATVENQRKAPPIPVMRLLRTRCVSTFPLSKVFSDPVWYFYIYWFPKYLASARGFDLLNIAKLAWVPFATADAGNLIGGWLS